MMDLSMETLFRGLYKGKRVLVTGHTGFKGSWLTIWLRKLGAQVIGYSDATLGSRDLFASAGLDRICISITGNVEDQQTLVDVFDRYRPDMVFHLAAQSLVRRSYLKPLLTFRTNVLGTVNVLEAVRKTDSVRALVNVTSDKCYENKGMARPFSEDDPKGGQDPYSSSKACAELAFDSYLQAYFQRSPVSERPLGAASVRAGNVVGGGDWAEDRLVPDCIRALLANRPIEVRSPRSTRPWLFVLDALSAYLWLGANLILHPTDYSGGWNFGPAPFDRTGRTVRELVQHLVRCWGHGEITEVHTQDRSTMPEAQCLTLNTQKAKDRLGWEALCCFAEAIINTVSWYRITAGSSSQNALYDGCIDQLNSFVHKARSAGSVWANSHL
jgi:CDP-glucose 4,6-dehydratase